MEKRLRLVYEVENGNRRFPMGYEFDCYNLDADYNVWDVIFDDGEYYHFEFDACVEVEVAEGTPCNRYSFMDVLEHDTDDMVVDYVNEAQKHGVYVAPGEPNYANKVTAEELERMAKIDRYENG